MEFSSLRLTVAAGVALGLLLALPAARPQAAQGFQQRRASGPEVTARQQAECLAGGAARVARDASKGTLRFIGTEAGAFISRSPQVRDTDTPESATRAFLSVCGSLFGLRGEANELTLMRDIAVEGDRTIIRLQQRFQGIPVLGGELIVHLDRANNIRTVAGKTLDPAAAPAVAPAVPTTDAIAAALNIVAKTYGADRATLSTSAPQQWIYDPAIFTPDQSPPRLVWRLEVTHATRLDIRELVLIDAVRGSVALHFNQVETALNRFTYTANNGTSLPGTLVCNESNPTCSGGDTHAVAAHLYASDTYNFYLTNHGRNSLDNAGLSLISTVHYLTNYQNAFWNGSQMVYGDASGFPLADDVVAHELTHGVTQYTSNLFYYYQSGAINESFSDVWGEFVDQTNGHGTDNDSVRWLIGEDVTGLGALRNMQNPPQFNDPDKITSGFYYLGSDDQGGVHTNSGVNNKAAYLMVDGGTFNGQTVVGLGIPKVAKIYYEVQTHLLTSGADYGDLFEALYQGCTNLVGTSSITSNDCQQVRNATLAVEMNLQPLGVGTPDAPFCAAGSAPSNVFFDNFENGSSNFVFGATVGTTRWRYGSPYGPYAHSGIGFLYADDYPATLADSTTTMASGVVIPNSAFLHFAHAYGFERPSYDGGVLEYSVNGGTTWIDAGPLFEANGYTGVVTTGYQNPLAGRSAFVGASRGYISSRLNLSTLEGQTVRFRWRLGLDINGLDQGWWLDDVRIYKCLPIVPPPIVSSIAPASGPTLGGTPVTITGTGFSNGATVTIGGVPAVNVVVVSATSITANTGPRIAGIVDVVVTNPDTQTGTLPNGFTYVASPAPSVSGISPASGPTAGGTAITITGSGFAAGALVSIGGAAATNVVVLNSTSITAITRPHAAGVFSVVVTNVDTQTSTLSNAFTYVAIPPPVVTSISPSSGGTLGGTAVMITGTGFVAGATVSIGGSAATQVVVINSTTISATTGPRVSSGAAVVVTNGDLQSGTLPNGFTYVPDSAPTITSISPAAGPTTGGTPVTIKGTGFVAGATVLVGGLPATNVAVLNATTVTATTAAHAPELVDVRVTNVDFQLGFLPQAFMFSALPSNDSFANRYPLIGSGSLTAIGSNTGFSSEAGEPTDSIPNGGTAPSAWWTWTAPCSFTVAAPASFVDTIGSNFDTVVSMFTGTTLQSLALFASDDQSGGNSTSRVPGVGSVTVVAGSVFQIRVRGYSIQTGSIRLHINSPDCGNITSIAPNSGLHGTTQSFTITGTQLENTIAVNFSGSGLVAAVTGATATTVSATVTIAPAALPNARAVSVTSVSGGTSSAFNSFTVTSLTPPPVIISITPPSGLIDGGTSITISGTGFSDGATVSLGDVPAINVAVVNSTTITAVTPPHVAGAVNVRMTNPDTQAFLLLNGFTYLPPPLTLISISPQSGPSAGGTPIIINGTGFAAGATVSLGGVAATNVVVVDAKTITATSAAHAAGVVNVVVNANTQNATLTGGFTYVNLPTNDNFANRYQITGSGALTATGSNSGFTTETDEPSDPWGGTGNSTAWWTWTAPCSFTVTSPTSFIDTVGSNFDTVLAVYTGSSLQTLSLFASDDQSGGGDTSRVPGSGSLNIAAGTVFQIRVRNWSSTTGTIRLHVNSPSCGTMTGITPNSGLQGTTLTATITGTDLNNATAVTFSGTGVTASINNSNATSVGITVTIAASALPNLRTVSVRSPSGGSSMPFSGFTVTSFTPPPVITSISPNSGPSNGGTPLTITGTGFATGATVSIGVAPTNVVVLNSTTITAITAAHPIGAVDVVVTNPDTQVGTLTTGFTYAASPPPALTSIVPASGPAVGGTPVTIKGSGFGSGAAVTIGGVAAANVIVVNTNTITATTGVHAAGTVDVVVANGDQQAGSLTQGYSFVSASSNDNFANRYVVTGSGNLTASGTNVGFTSEPNEPTDTHGNGSASAWWTWTAACSFTVTSPDSFIDTIGSNFDTVLEVYTGSTLQTLTLFAGDDDSGGSNTSKIPSFGSLTIAAGTVFQIRVQEYAGSGGSIKLHVNSPSCGVITGITPISGLQGTTLNATISGTDLADATAVVFSGTGVTGTITNKTATTVSISVTITSGAPPNLRTIAVSSSSGGTSLPFSGFTVTSSTPPPTLSSISPATGGSLGGTAVTISGTGFAIGATVSIGGVAPTNVIVMNATTITAVTGPHAVGVVNVVVTNPDTQTGTLPNGFTYGANTPPAITSIIPTSGATVGGTPVTIKGTGFGAGATVSIGGVPATNVVVVNTVTITATTAAHAAAAVDVSVSNSDLQTGSLPQGYTFISLPANDDFANRYVVTGSLSLTSSGTNVGFTSETGEPTDNQGGSGTATAWWTWTAPCSFTVTSPSSFIDTIDSSFDTVLAIYTGGSLQTLTLVAADDQSGGGNGTSRIPGFGSIDITAGTVYQIRVRNWSFTTGSITLHINIPSCPTINITGSTVTEGNSGVTNAAFPVTLSAASSLPVTVHYQTSGGTATPSSDNLAPITIPDSGAATPYPSTVTVPAGLGPLTKVRVQLFGFSHTYPADVDILLVGPGGQSVVLMSDVGGGTSVENLTLRFDDNGPSMGSTALTSGTYHPTNIDTFDSWPSPAPAGAYGSALSVFNGTDPGGTWRLFVVDDLGGLSGSISGGWSLELIPSPSSPDYLSSSGTITFNPGETAKVINISVVGDTLPEPTETFFVNLSTPTNAAIGNATGIGTILDDDTAAPKRRGGQVTSQ